MSFLLIIAFLISFARAEEPDFQTFVRDLETPADHPEERYRFRQEIYGQLAELVRERPGVVVPFRVGETVEHRPIWGFRVRAPGSEPKVKVLVFAGIHALERIGTEVATTFLLEMGRHRRPASSCRDPAPQRHGRARTEADLLAGENICIAAARCELRRPQSRLRGTARSGVLAAHRAAYYARPLTAEPARVARSIDSPGRSTSTSR
jgi:hypothetical protein